MPKIKRQSLLRVFSAVVLSGLVSTAAASSVDPPAVVKVICIPARPLALSAAEANGTFAKYGLTVQTNVAPNSDVLRSGIADGSFDVAHGAVDNDVAAVEAGSDQVIVMGGEGSTNEVIAQPEIRSIADLRGKIVIVDAPHTAFALQLKQILLLNGIKPGVDCEIRQVGSTPQRLQAMREHKEYAASILGAPTSILAKADGFHSLGTTQQLLGAYQGIGAFAQRRWVTQNSSVLVRYIAAFIEAQRWLLAPGNKDQVIALMAKEWKLQPDAAAATYSVLTSPGGLERDAQFDVDGFKNTLKLRAIVEGQWGGNPPAPEKYYDPAYFKQALALANSKQ